MKKAKILFAGIFLVLGLTFFYFTFLYGCLEFRRNTDTPEKFLNHSIIRQEDYNKDKSTLLVQFKKLIEEHSGFFKSSEYFEGTEIIIDTIVYNSKYDKLAILIITKNPTSRQLIPTRNEAWYYNATSYLGVRLNDSISLSWLGNNFTNSTDSAEISHDIREACFRNFVTTDTVGEYAHKYNLNDTRFWTSNEWVKIEKKKLEMIEFEEMKRKHPEDVNEQPK